MFSPKACARAFANFAGLVNGIRVIKINTWILVVQWLAKQYEDKKDIFQGNNMRIAGGGKQMI